MKFSDIKPLLERILKPQSLEVLERAKFNSRVQKPGEDASSYALALREMAQSCNFSETLYEQLRDKFIVGLYNEEMRRVVLSSNQTQINLMMHCPQRRHWNWQIKALALVKVLTNSNIE